MRGRVGARGRARAGNVAHQNASVRWGPCRWIALLVVAVRRARDVDRVHNRRAIVDLRQPLLRAGPTGPCCLQLHRGAVVDLRCHPCRRWSTYRLVSVRETDVDRVCVRQCALPTRHCLGKDVTCRHDRLEFLRALPRAGHCASSAERLRWAPSTSKACWVQAVLDGEIVGLLHDRSDCGRGVDCTAGLSSRDHVRNGSQRVTNCQTVNFCRLLN